MFVSLQKQKRGITAFEMTVEMYFMKNAVFFSFVGDFVRLLRHLESLGNSDNLEIDLISQENFIKLFYIWKIQGA